MRASLLLEGLSRRHSVSLAILPVFGADSLSGDRSLARRLAAHTTTLPIARQDDARRWVAERLATPAGRRRLDAIHPLPSLCRLASREGVAELRRTVERVALVVVMRAYLMPALDFLLDEPRRPTVILDLDELDSDVQRQLSHEQEAVRFERLERHYLPRVDHVTVAAEPDASILKERHRLASVSTLINAVRPPAAVTEPAPPHDLLFVGNLAYAPNVEAADWLCREVMPRLPDTTIALVGSSPGPAIAELAESPGVTLAADVADVTPWYDAARVAVAPLHSGGGTRTKIVEALLHGRPVVATSVGARGLPTGGDAGVLIADDPGAFARACRALLDDPGQAAQLAAAGRRRLPSAEQVIAQIDELVSRAVRDRPRPRLSHRAG